MLFAGREPDNTGITRGPIIEKASSLNFSRGKRREIYYSFVVKIVHGFSCKNR